jgi:predicted RecB family nuclease
MSMLDTFIERCNKKLSFYTSFFDFEYKPKWNKEDYVLTELRELKNAVLECDKSFFFCFAI